MAWSPEGELDYLNRRAVEYLGHTAETGKPGEGVAQPSIPITAMQLCNAGCTRPQRERVTAGDQYGSVWVDGQYRWIQSVGEPFHDSEGRIANWYGLVIDIDDLKRAEVELRRAYDSFADAQRLSKYGQPPSTDLVRHDQDSSEEALRIFEVDSSDEGYPAGYSRSAIHPEDMPGSKRRSNAPLKVWM